MMKSYADFAAQETFITIISVETVVLLNISSQYFLSIFWWTERTAFYL